MNQNSLDAYDRIRDSLSPARAAVYSALVQIGPMTDQQISARLGWEINRVTGRRSELAEMRCVQEVGSVTDPITGMRRTLWEATTDYFAAAPKQATRAKELAAALETARTEIEALRGENARLRERLAGRQTRQKSSWAASSQTDLFADAR